jgi:hypothetical protein
MKLCEHVGGFRDVHVRSRDTTSRDTAELLWREHVLPVKCSNRVAGQLDILRRHPVRIQKRQARGLT